MQRKLFLGIGLVAAFVSNTRAEPSLALPFGGMAQGYSVTVPVTLKATNSLAGIQCDVVFDGTRLSCSNAPTLVSGPSGVVVDGAAIQPGRLRLLAYMPTGDALTNDVVCNVTFTAATNAYNGQAPLGSSGVFFGSTSATDIGGVVNPGLVLVGDAFGFFPTGGRAQFRWTTGANCIIKATEDLTQWTPMATNSAVEELVWVVDPAAKILPHRFYRGLSAP